MTASLQFRPQSPATPSIGRAHAADEDRVAAVLARAFDDDPVFRFLIPADTRGPLTLRRFFRNLVRELAMPHGEVRITSSSDGTAVWLPPGADTTGLGQQIRLLPTMIKSVGLRGLPRLLRTLSLMDAHHPKEPHFYLMLLGVDPDRQGQGIGSDLLREVLDGCDRDGVPAYLEASSPRNVPLYERWGFVVREQLDLPGGGPALWPMWRRPT